MLTRKLINPGLSLAALLLGLFSQQVAATEEIVVHGGDAVARVEARQAMFRSELNDYVRSLNEQIKSTLQDDLRRLAAPKLTLASAQEAVRG